MTTPRLPPELNTLPRWTPERDGELTELVSTDRYSFTEIGQAMNLSKATVLGRFQRIAARMEGRCL